MISGLKVFVLQLLPTDGMIRKHSHVKIGRYHQVTSGSLAASLLCFVFRDEFELLCVFLASNGAAGARPVSTGVHDEVFP